MAALDALIGGLQAGDNLVWQIDAIEQYRAFCEPLCTGAIADGIPVVYFRFARHEALVEPGEGVTVITLSPQTGFEGFIDAIHAEIAAHTHAYYIFDCLTDLAADWFSDLMLGNFFVLTCPYILEARHLAYFALLRNRHSSRATEPIRNTTQLLIDVYSHHGGTYLRPLKAKEREAAGVALLHRWTDEGASDVTDSCTIAEILNATTRAPLEQRRDPLDVWQRAFMRLDDLEQAPSEREDAADTDLHERLLRMVVSRDPRMLDLARRWLTPEDLRAIGRRIIGSGLIGGKAVGMLLARAIVRRSDPAWERLLEANDSFYVASDVFYTYLVHNGCWHLRRMLKCSDILSAGDAERARQRMLEGEFPGEILEQFAAMLDYFGQSPIIIRSSSLLEDDFGNSFAGKYESVFCANQGSHEARMQALVDAVRRIYASTLSEEALDYRARRGLLGRDEQMALLIQRVSGARHGPYFFPQFAGVAYSFNPFVWSPAIDPSAGVLRLVFGLGTRAVDRADDDYTRIVALNAPQRIPDADYSGQPMAAQRNVDVLDLFRNEHRSIPFSTAAAEWSANDYPPFLRRPPADQGRNVGSHPQMDLGPLLSSTAFVDAMRGALVTLQSAYDHPVDVEFAVNFQSRTDFRIHMLQCRPFHYRGSAPVVEFPEDIARERVVFEGQVPIIGHSRAESLDTVVWVRPERYCALSLKERYAFARALGRMLRAMPDAGCTLLAGPGRWGTSTPSLGIPVSFAEINSVGILVELGMPSGDVMPDLSLGTHFFSEMVEANMLYVAFPVDDAVRPPVFEILTEYAVPADALGSDMAKFGNVAVVARVGGAVRLVADTAGQRIACYLDSGADSVGPVRSSTTV